VTTEQHARRPPSPERPGRLRHLTRHTA